jgi:hypothetical protein
MQVLGHGLGVLKNAEKRRLRIGGYAGISACRTLQPNAEGLRRARAGTDDLRQAVSISDNR